MSTNIFLENCPFPTKPSMGHIIDCLDQQRKAMEHLVAHVGQMIRGRADVAIKDDLRECKRQRRQLEKALELSKQAEAKIQVLIVHSEGGLG